jgi:hypothetical protein
MNLHQKSPELLPPAAADCATVVRLIKIHEEPKSSITNRPPRPTYPRKKSVLTSEATPVEHSRENKMKLLLRRDQKSGLLGKVTFTLTVRAELSDEEQSNIRKYKLGDTMLYERETLTEKGSGLLGVASRLAFKMMNISVSVADLSGGKKIDCKDIVEMLAVEDQIKEAAQTFKNVLQAAATFGGEEVMQLT